MTKSAQEAIKRKHEKEISSKQILGNLGSSAIKTFAPAAKALIKNDPEWYKKYVPDTNAFVNVPTFYRLGDTLANGEYSNASPTTRIPGIMVFDFYPAVGSNLGRPLSSASVSDYFANSPLNVALNRSKEMILRLNSRSSVNYEASDIGYNIFCTADIVETLGELRRAIAVFHTYHSNNAYLAKLLILALGYNFADMEEHINEYEKLYVEMALRFNNNIVAPLGLSLYQRKWWISTNVFTDAKGVTYGQLYAFKQEKYFRLAEDATEVEFDDVTRSGPNAQGIRTQLNLMISRIADNPDFREMYEDMRHAFKDKLYQVPTDIPTSITFNDDEMNRTEIENLSTAPAFTFDGGVNEIAPSVDGTWCIRQTSEGYMYQGALANGAYVFRLLDLNLDFDARRASTMLYDGNMTSDFGTPTFGTVFNSHNEKISSDEILDATRLRTQWSMITNGGFPYWTAGACGTEVVMYGHIITMLDNTSGVNLYDTLFSTYTAVYRHGVTDDEIVNADIQLQMSNVFDWSPLRWLSYAVFDAQDDLDYGPYYICTSDINHGYRISQADFGPLTDICVMSTIFLSESDYSNTRS